MLEFADKEMTFCDVEQLESIFETHLKTPLGRGAAQTRLKARKGD